MWSKDCSDKQTYQENEPPTLTVDSGFESGISENMRDCSGLPDLKLSETLIRNIQMKHPHINNLETARRHQQRLQQHQQNIPSAVPAAGDQQLTDSRLDAKWAQIDRLQGIDLVNENYKKFYAQDEDGDTYLHIMVARKQVEASIWLINQAPHPCLLNIANDDMQTALHLAVMVHEPLIVRRLVLAGSNPRLCLASGDTALHLACARGDLSCVQALTEPVTIGERSWLVEKQPVMANDLELRNFNGKTCLHIAAMQGHVKLVEQLVRRGADVETRDGLGGRTALHLAVENNCLDVVRWLLSERPCCINKTTYAGYTAYHIALGVNLQLAQELLSFGASSELRSDSDSDSSSGNSTSDESMSESSSDEEFEPSCQKPTEHYTTLSYETARRV